MSSFRLALVPAVITLLVTLLRLVGELRGWSPTLFNPAPGGGFALVGITWLVLIFGMYFALKLHGSGVDIPVWRTLGFGALAIVAFVGVFYVLNLVMGIDPNQPTIRSLIAMVIASVVALAVAYYGSPALGKVLVTYGLLARIPVILVMLLAILGNWGTHYDVLPPGAPEMAPFTKWFLIGVLPQLTLWMAFTVAVGAFFGGIALAVASRRHAVTRAA